ncbi:MAG: hypothetical protein PGN25_11495 [Methylorubrum populi]
MKSLSGRASQAHSAWSAVVPLILIAATAHADQTHRFNIPRGDLATELTQIALTSGIPIVAQAHLVAGRMAGPISGCGTAETAETALTEALAGTASAVGSDRNGGLVLQGLAVDARASTAMHWAKGEPAAGTMPSDRGLVPAGIISDHRSSAHPAPGAAGDCGADDGASEVAGAAASGLVRLGAE